MSRIYLVRHGRAAASWSEDPDPGLDELGITQAHQAAVWLQDHTPLAVISSPLKRAMETAAPLCQQLQCKPELEPRVAEIPSPGLGLQERGPWLMQVMQGGWSEVSAELAAWRQSLLASLCELKADTAVFSHFIAINVAVGSATGDDRVVHFRPDNGSITVLDTDGTSLHLVTRGAEATTHIG